MLSGNTGWKWKLSEVTVIGNVMGVMDDAEIRIKGIEALSQALGPSAALRFLTLLHRKPTDYVEISRRLPVRLCSVSRLTGHFAGRLSVLLIQGGRGTVGF